MKTKKLLFYLLAALLGGCIPVMSLHPLYTPEVVVFDEKLIGIWVDAEDPNSNITWEFKRPDESEKGAEKTYKLILSAEEGKKAGSFAANLVKLENRLFLDVYPNKFPCKEQDEEEMEWPYNTYFIVPVHTFIKIHSIEPQLSMWLTDDDDFEKLLKEDPNAVKYEVVEKYGGGIVLTASTEELQQFVLKYADDRRVFSKEVILSRKKVKIPQKLSEQDPNEGPKESRGN